MTPTNQGEVTKLSQVIQIDEGKIQEHLGEVVRSTVEETLNAMLDKDLRPDRKLAEPGDRGQAPVCVSGRFMVKGELGRRGAECIAAGGDRA